MNGLYDDFDSLYELYDNDEPTLYVDSYMYNIQQYGTNENPRLLYITVTDLSKVPKGADCYDEKYEVAQYDIKNSFEFINNFKLANGKTLAQMMCDANGWDYSILPAYPKWLTPLGTEIPPHIPTVREQDVAVERANKITEEDWNQDIQEMHEEGDTEGLKIYEEAEREERKKNDD